MPEKGPKSQRKGHFGKGHFVKGHFDNEYRNEKKPAKSI